MVELALGGGPARAAGGAAANSAAGGAAADSAATATRTDTGDRGFRNIAEAPQVRWRWRLYSTGSGAGRRGGAAERRHEGGRGPIVRRRRSGPKHQIDVKEIRGLGMAFGGEPLPRDTVAELVEAHRR